MTTATIDDSIKRIEIEHVDVNDILLLCNAFATSHGFKMNDKEVRRIRESGLELIRSDSGFDYSVGLGHSLNLKTEKGALLVKYDCSGNPVMAFDRSLEKYRELAKSITESHKRLKDLNFI